MTQDTTAFGDLQVSSMVIKGDIDMSLIPCHYCKRPIDDGAYKVIDLGVAWAHINCPPMFEGDCDFCKSPLAEDDPGQFTSDGHGPFHTEGCLESALKKLTEAEYIDIEDYPHYKPSVTVVNTKKLEIIVSKYVVKGQKETPHFYHGVDVFDPEKVHWRQLNGWGEQNLEYLPFDRQEKIRDFIQRLEWVGGTNIRWVRGGEAIWATLPQEFLLARYLKGGHVPPPTGSVQYYLQAGAYKSMAYETPPRIGHVCKIARKCVVCGKEFPIHQADLHERKCVEPRKARCNYMPAKLRMKRLSYHGVSNPWAKLLAKHGCKKLVPALLKKKGNHVTLFRQHCEKHTQIEQWVEPWMKRAQQALENRTKFGAKKPACCSCEEPIKGNGFTLNDRWYHPQCANYHLSMSKNKNGLVCALHEVPTEGNPEIPDAIINVDGEWLCRKHAIEYLKSKPYANMFHHSAFFHLSKGYASDEEEDEDEDEFLEGTPNLKDLGPEPDSSAPNGWVPQKDFNAEYTAELCGLCLMTIGMAERVEKDGKLYHSDCAPALAVLA